MNWIIYIIILLFFSLVNFSSASVIGKVREGNAYYRKEKYEQAVEKYRDAQIDRPRSGQLHFNLAAGLYKLEKFEEADKEWQKATYSKDIKLQAKAYYNLGNSAFRQGKLTEAIQYYQKALELDSTDEDAKYNLEYTRKKLKEMARKQQQKQQSADKQQKDRQKEEQKKTEEKQQQKAEQEEKKSATEQGKKKEGEMSKEEAQRLLEALKDQEEKAQEKKAHPSFQVPSVNEDW